MRACSISRTTSRAARRHGRCVPRLEALSDLHLASASSTITVDSNASDPRRTFNLAMSTYSTSTKEDDDQDTVTHDIGEMDQIYNEISMWAKTGQAKKAEQVFEERTRNLELTASELTTCYNYILLGWSRSRDVDAAEMAQQVLQSMPVPPSLLSLGYVLESWSKSKLSKKSGKNAGQYAERLLRQMQEMGLQDQHKAYHNVLKACAKGGDGDRAVRLLKEFIQQQQEEATKSNSQLHLKRHVLSTVLLALKTRPQQAEKLLESLHSRFGLRPDEVHYGLVLSAWANSGNGPQAEALINKMLMAGVMVDVGAYNHLLHAWRDDLDRMEDLFRAMLDDYIQCPYRDSQHNKSSIGTKEHTSSVFAAVKPNVETLSRVLAALAQGENPKRAEALLHAVVNDPEIRTFLRPNVFCLNSILYAWARDRQPKRAEALLRRMQQGGYELNVVSFTTVMHAWSMVGNFQRAEALWRELINHPNQLRPNLNTLNILLLAYANAKPHPQPELGQDALQRAAKEANLQPDVSSYSTILRSWESAGRPDKARALLEELRLKEREENVVLLDVISYSIVFQAYSKAGMPEEAEELLSSMLHENNANVSPNAQCFSQVLSAYTRSQNPLHRQVAGNRAEELLQQMEDRGITPNMHTLNVMLQCFATSGYPERAENLLWHIVKNNTTKVDTVTYNTCLHAWARVGNALRAEQLLLDLATAEDSINANTKNQKRSSRGRPPLDAQSFSIVLFAWAKQGTVEAAKHTEDVLRHMHTLAPGCKPDTVSYNTVLRAWLNVALNDKNNPEIALRCAERADLLLSEMEELHQTQGLDRVRPDRLSFKPVIRLWRMGGNGERAKKLEARARSLRIL